MISVRLLPLLLGAGVALVALPGATASASPTRTTVMDPAALLERAAVAGRSRSYTGVQFASSWTPRATSASVSDVRHTPAAGSVVAPRTTVGSSAAAEQVVASTTELDPRLLRLLSVHYQLSLGAREPSAGRGAQVVEARRLDSSVAGRFWLDVETGLLLRREVYDDAGHLVRSSAFTALDVQPPLTTAVGGADLLAAPGGLTDDEVAQRRAQWPIPNALPGGLDLFDARVRTHDSKQVLHLSYSDGLSTLSVFAQPGRLGSEPLKGLHAERLAGAPVWAAAGTPARVVWSGAGQVFTLLSDAPASTVTAAVSSLPHDAPPRTGVLARLGRGLARLASWLNPFD